MPDCGLWVVREFESREEVKLVFACLLVGMDDGPGWERWDGIVFDKVVLVVSLLWRLLTDQYLHLPYIYVREITPLQSQIETVVILTSQYLSHIVNHLQNSTVASPISHPSVYQSIHSPTTNNH